MRRLYGVLVTLFSLILMLGVAPAPLADVGANSNPSAPSAMTMSEETHEHHHKSGVPTGTQVIWCGLWNGSNFNFTDECSEIGSNDEPHEAQHMQQASTQTDKTSSTSAPNEETSSTATMNHTTTVKASASASATVSHSSTDMDNDGDTDTTSSQPQSSTPSSMSESSQQPVMSAEPSTASSNSTQPSSSSNNATNSCTSNCENGTQTVPTGTAIIWCGLWEGSNFNVSGDCSHIGDDQATVTLPAADPPNQNSNNSSSTPSTSNTSSTPAANAMTVASDPPASTSGGTYAALGDSVAAGLGLPLPANADASTTACGRSSQGYPNLVTSSMNLSLLNVSCSSTTMGDLLTSENVGGVEQSPQLDQAFAHGTPKVISITSGANDIEWSFFLKQCYVTNCADMTNTVAVNGLLVALQAKMLATLSSIQARSHGTPPRTVVTGYYQPVSTACVQQSNGQLTSAEVQWIQGATNALNQTLKQTTQQFSFARFAPVSFAGHDACSSNPWVQMINAPAPFHPTAQGQQVIARDVEAAMNQ